MASFVEVEKLALALSEHERATLAAKLIDSLPENNSDRDDESGAIRFKTVKSSMLRRVRYDPKNGFLDVVFRTGEKYRYKNVPPDEYNGLMKAESHGKYMQMHIIDRYEVVRLEDEEPSVAR
jgi:KTSC domain